MSSQSRSQNYKSGTMKRRMALYVNGGKILAKKSFFSMKSDEINRDFSRLCVWQQLRDEWWSDGPNCG